MLQSAPTLPEIYSTALSELQDLESKPLCHRIAARLLVNNCQLLDGKDEATVLTDSGCETRDFIDAYAASMAICDLERGRFSIPKACDRLREPALLKLPLFEQATLHVSSSEIDSCLTGLSLEPSAWSTWVSYRHKALMFCEAARADHTKTQNVLLYQRITKIMAKMADGVDKELEKHLSTFELRAKEAGDALHNLGPELDYLRDRLAMIQTYVTRNLTSSFEKSSNSINDGLQNALTLQQLLSVMVRTVLDGTSQVAAEQAKSIEVFDKRVQDADNWLAVMESAAVSAATTNQQIELARFEVEALQIRHQVLSSSLEVLIQKTDTLSAKYDAHLYDINEAKNTTSEILEKLDGVMMSAATIAKASQSRWTLLGLGDWMPYIISPVATLLLGSYGLTPSATRNLGLVVLGEGFGFLVAYFHKYSTVLVNMSGLSMPNNGTAGII
ncbi:hypothetical protein BD289DRAFT_384178 [Coniella lustricola]|uniref:Nuclear membrane fusion protein Kar5 n=1 Tax=Coniella lustricola TaxID=2025994 RepID=A0A2T3AGY5_9PEZI|nr:hypothetical protein BD289DRAFT_384178 [Coniella lustricola]